MPAAFGVLETDGDADGVAFEPELLEPHASIASSAADPAAPAMSPRRVSGFMSSPVCV